MSDLNMRDLHSTEFPVPADLQENVAITSLSKIYNWGRRG